MNRKLKCVTKKNKQTKTTGYIECEGKQQAYHIFEIIFS